MSEQTPQQPGWGQQPGQPPYGYAPPPKKKSSAGKIIAIVLGSIVGFFVLVGGCAAVMVSGDSSGGTDDTSVSADKEPAAGGKDKAAAEEEPAADSPIKIQATKTEFTPGVLHAGGDFTSVKVTITNNSDENIDVNPLSFAVTDTDGTKHPTDALAEDENQIDTVTLAPGENVTGAICAEGAFEPKTVTFEENMFIGEPITVDVK